MKRNICFNKVLFLVFALVFFCREQVSAQSQEACFEYSGTALFAGLWFGDGQTNFNRTRIIDGNLYHQAKIWATGEYRLELIEAFESGIPGIRFFPDENNAQNEPKNMNFWVDSEGPFKDHDPENSGNSGTEVAAPAQFVETRSEILSWMMGVIYGEGWRTGTIMDDSKTVGLARISAAKTLMERAGFETVSIEEKSNKYRLYITSSEFSKVLALPFRKWTRVPGNEGSSEPPSDVDQYASCIDEGMNANYDESLGNIPGTNVKMSVLDNDILPNGSQATYEKIKFDLNPDSSSLNTWAGTDTYAWRINLSGQLVFKPKNGFDGKPKTLEYLVIDVATGLSDTVIAKVSYNNNGSEPTSVAAKVYLHSNPVNQGKQLQIQLPEDSVETFCNVFDMNGKLVDQFTVSGTSGAFETDGLKQGNYILQMSTAQQSETIIFVIQ